MRTLLLSIFLFFGFNSFGQFTLIPDSNFESALITQGYDTLPLDGQVPTANINTLTLLDVSSKNIADLTGIEDFTALQDLDLGNNVLTSLDLSQNSNLKRLWALYNPFTCINLQNGNNENIVLFHAYQCPNLVCIQVDDVVHSDTTWISGAGFPLVAYNFDSISVFSDYCNDCNVGLDELSRANLSIYPNPVQSELTITSSKSIQKLKIIDITGKNVYHSYHAGFSHEVNCQSFKDGVYFVSLTYSDGSSESKLFLKAM